MSDQDLKKLYQELEKVKGWLTFNEGVFLYNTAKNCNSKYVIVEIGSWQGKSTIWLAKGSLAGNKARIYAIDPHTGSSEHKNWYKKVWTFDIFKENIKNFKVDNIITPLIKTSAQAAKEWDGKPIQFLWIDGAHEYKYVLLDYKLWTPYLINGGIIAFHDTSIGWEGPAKVAKQYLYFGTNFKNVGFVDSITYGTKCDKISLFDKLKNRLTYLIRKFHIFITKLYIRLQIQQIPFGHFLRKIITKIF